MNLTPEQFTKFGEHFKSKASVGACPMCGNKSWITGPMLHALTWADGAITLGGEAVPIAIVICTQCSFIAQFAAVPIGLVSAKQVLSSSSPPASGTDPKAEVVAPLVPAAAVVQAPGELGSEAGGTDG